MISLEIPETRKIYVDQEGKDSVVAGCSVVIK